MVFFPGVTRSLASTLYGAACRLCLQTAYHPPHAAGSGAAPVLAPILFCSSSGPHLRSRTVAALVSVSIMRPFARLHPRSRSRYVPVPVTIQVSVPVPTPILPPTPFAPSPPSDPVTPSVQCSCTDVRSCEQSCRVPASATPCLQRLCCVRNERVSRKTKKITAADVLLPSPPPDAGRANPYRETKFSGANGDKEMFIFRVKLTTRGISNLTWWI